MRFKLSGILPAILTPFTRGGAKVDYVKACIFANVLADRGADGLFVCGSTGEGLLMTLGERKQLAGELVDAVGKRMKIVVQTGCLDTPSTIELTRHAQEIGAHAAAVYAPGVYTYDDRALAGHFEGVAKAVPKMPLLLYNIPQYMGNALSADLIARLARKVDSIVGMKDSSGDMMHLSRVIASVPKGFTTINGADEMSYQAYLTGASGSVAMTANVAPELFRTIFDSVKAGKLPKALRAQQKLAGITKVLGYGQMIAICKEAVRLQGYDMGHVRPPQRELTSGEKRELAKTLEAAGII